jgi:GTP-binding protein
LKPIVSASFIISSAELSQCPKPVLPEYAFIGRSNVGKSSLINMLTGQKMLAKISTAPGKTRLINHFLINEQWYLVDLPGYGYAKVGHQTRKKWEKLIETYLLKRDSLMSTFLLVDSRLPLQDNDRQVISWFGENQLPFVIVMTKADKLSRVEADQNFRSFSKSLMEDWEELPRIILSSSKTREGREEILGYIDESNRLFIP